MTLDIRNGDCLELMKSIPDKSIDLMICDLPYGETNCKWDTQIDLTSFWDEFRRIRKSKRTACIHFCSTKFGYNLINSWEKGFKMDMVWKKRNKTGGLQSRHRPMRNHEMIYFFYEQAPKYNRDKYHKRIQAKLPIVKDDEQIMGKGYEKGKEPVFCSGNEFEPPNPASVVEEKNEGQIKAEEWGWTKCSKSFDHNEELNGSGSRIGPKYEPPNPCSVLEDNELDVFDYIENPEDAPFTVYNSTKVFIGKRHHQTEKPQDILEFFLKYWTDEGETVLDPTMGSGSTGVACKNLKRNFIGFELDEKIFKVAQDRVSGKLDKKEKPVKKKVAKKVKKPKVI